MNDLNTTQLTELCHALGWQGGTYHQVLEEVKRLADNDTRRSVTRASDQCEARCAMHVDDWLDQGAYDAIKHPEENYARFVLELARLPAWKRSAYRPWTHGLQIFCTWTDGKRYRVTGASRLGDVWLARNHSQEHGYDLRVNVEDCTSWGATP